jgi:transcriptional regulator with XRE-family HTH domain
MRQEDLAVALGLSVAYVSLIERGRRNPPITTVLALAEALHATPAELLAREPIIAEVEAA